MRYRFVARLSIADTTDIHADASYLSQDSSLGGGHTSRRAGRALASYAKNSGTRGELLSAAALSGRYGLSVSASPAVLSRITSSVLSIVSTGRSPSIIFSKVFTSSSPAVLMPWRTVVSVGLL